jgi:hypothetical protein
VYSIEKVSDVSAILLIAAAVHENRKFHFHVRLGTERACLLAWWDHNVLTADFWRVKSPVFIESEESKLPPKRNIRGVRMNNESLVDAAEQLVKAASLVNVASLRFKEETESTSTAAANKEIVEAIQASSKTSSIANAAAIKASSNANVEAIKSSIAACSNANVEAIEASFKVLVETINNKASSMESVVAIIEASSKSTMAAITSGNETFENLKKEVLATVNTKIDDMKKEVEDLNLNLVEQKKRDNVAWAIQFAQLELRDMDGAATYEIHILRTVLNILFEFRRGKGKVVREHSELHYISERLHELTGVKPRLVEDSSTNEYTFYYE